MELIDFTTQTLADGSLHEISTFACGCVDDTIETPERHVLMGLRQYYCAEHGGPRPGREPQGEPWGFSCGTTLPQR